MYYLNLLTFIKNNEDFKTIFCNFSATQLNNF